MINREYTPQHTNLAQTNITMINPMTTAAASEPSRMCRLRPFHRFSVSICSTDVFAVLVVDEVVFECVPFVAGAAVVSGAVLSERNVLVVGGDVDVGVAFDVVTDSVAVLVLENDWVCVADVIAAVVIVVVDVEDDSVSP